MFIKKNNALSDKYFCIILYNKFFIFSYILFFIRVLLLQITFEI